MESINSKKTTKRRSHHSETSDSSDDEIAAITSTQPEKSKAKKARHAATQSKPNQLVDDCLTVTNAYDRKTQSIPSIEPLQKFGASAKKLIVDYVYENHRSDQELEKAIVAHCRNSLVEITLNGVAKDGFTEFEDPFEHVTKVCFNGGFGAGMIHKFNKLFPNADTMHLLEMKLDCPSDSECIEQHFPKVTHLAVVQLGYPEYDTPDVDTFSVGNLEAAIELNPQITKLELKHNEDLECYDDLEHNAQYDGIQIDSELLKFINKKLPKLEALALDFTDDRSGRRINDKLHFENLKQLTIHFDNDLAISHITGAPLEYLSLKKSVYRLGLSQSYRDNTLKLAALNKNIAKLDLIGDWGKDFPFKQMLKGLSKLNEINLSHPIDYDIIIWVLNNCKLLLKLSVLNLTDAMVKRFETKFGKKGAKFKWTMRTEETKNGDKSTVFEKKEA